MMTLDDLASMDKECVSICTQMNRFPGVHTNSSCCGHGENDFRIWFSVDNLENLPRLLYWFKGCHSGVYGWRVEVNTDCGMNPVSFCLIGPREYDTRYMAHVYDEAEAIAVKLKEYMDWIENVSRVDTEHAEDDV